MGMAQSIQNSGEIRHPKPKSESDFPDRGKKIPVKFRPVRFFNIVSHYTKPLDYIEYRVYNRPVVHRGNPTQVSRGTERSSRV